MPGCLFYFCAEWRRSRRVLQLDALDGAGLRDVLGAIGADDKLLPSDCNVALKHGIAGWKSDLSEASELAAMLGSDALAEYSPTHPPAAEDGCQNDRPSSRGPLKKEITVGTAGRAATAKNGFGELTPRAGQLRRILTVSIVVPPDKPRGAAGPRLLGRGGRTLVANEKSVSLPSSLVFVNPDHPLIGLHDDCSKTDFVTEVRKRLLAERLFPSARHLGDGGGEPVLSVEEAEDLFETLRLMQQPARICGNDPNVLKLGRSMDAVVDMFFALTHFRQMMERGASSLTVFFSMLDLDKNNFVESSELKHFFKNAGTDCLEGASAALAAEGVSTSRLAESMFSVLDTDNNQRIELWELQRQLSLVVPPHMPLVELIMHMEMKYGSCNCNFYGRDSVDHTQFFDLLVRQEGLNMSPEDAMHCFRSALGGKNSNCLMVSAFETFLAKPPLEVTWGVEPHVADQFFCALGTRALTLERRRKQDACLPHEAVFNSHGLESLPDQSDLRSDFDRLWDRCGMPAYGSTGVEKHLRDGCFRRYQEAVQTNFDLVAAHNGVVGADGRRPALGSGPRSLFPNIGDVLATATTRLHAGQSIVIRYRLSGASNFWHPDHQVLKDERETHAWPTNKKVLGDTPFIGLVPRGLTQTSAGGGGFYLGQQAFSRVDPNLRADLPRDSSSGLPLLFGYVEIVAPSLMRTSRSQSKAKGVVEEFEVRMFCSSKHKITGCIGEPLQVQVLHQVRPPPVESLQARCEGRCVTLRWNILDLGKQAPKTGVDSVRLYMRSEKAERTFSLDPDTTEWEVQELLPDTEYEFRVRLENKAGHGLEAVTSCRINALSAAPASLTCAVLGTSYVELRWPRPRVLGNETTRDHHQQRKEAIASYEASLTVEDEDKDKDVLTEADELIGLAAPSVSTARMCQWAAGAWHEDKEGNVTARLNGLRPDTRYCLQGLCAVNSMGRGPSVKSLVFWTVPQTPVVAVVRVRHEKVLIALSQTGGASVKEYSITIFKTNRPEKKGSYTLPQSSLKPSADSGLHPELSLPFDAMTAAEPDETHSIQLRATNAGGWSEWSQSFETLAIARQQSAEQKQVQLIKAIEAHRIDLLSKLLDDVRDIEFSDERYVKEATELLAQLKSARQDLAEAMQVRDPGPLRLALERAIEVKLPDLEKAETLLRKLESAVLKLDTAKGIDALRLALRAANEVRLPQSLLTGAVGRLGTREAAQFGLEHAMEAARVPGLVAALKTGSGMNLPSEEAGQKLLVVLQHSESLLNAALASRRIHELEAALASAADSGLREDELIGEDDALLVALKNEQSAAHQRLLVAVGERHPGHIRGALAEAREAQVAGVELGHPDEYLRDLDGLMANIENAVGVEARAASIKAASDALVPHELLELAEEQLERLRTLEFALGRGDVDALRRVLRAAERIKLKYDELTQARIVYQKWTAAEHAVEVAMARHQTANLRTALEDAVKVGIAQDQLDLANKTLTALEHRDAAEQKLRDAIVSRKCESLQKALKASCDNDVADCPMLEEARILVEHLLHLRGELSAAHELAELQKLRVGIDAARKTPALPDKEILAAERLLEEFQQREAHQISDELRKAQAQNNFRAVDALASRATRARVAGVQLDEEALAELSAFSLAVQQGQRSQLEKDLQDMRTESKFPKWMFKTPECGEKVILPSKVVTGGLVVRFEPGGSPIGILPREIVEGTLVVALDDMEVRYLNAKLGPAIAKELGCGEQVQDYGVATAGLIAGRRIMDILVKALRRYLTTEDDVLRLGSSPTGSGDGVTALLGDCEDGKVHRGSSDGTLLDGRLELGVAMYVRSKARNGKQITKGICEADDPAVDLWRVSQEDTIPEHVADLTPTSKVLGSLPRALGRQFCLGAGLPAPDPRPAGPRRVADHVRGVRSRVLRRLNLELAWTYPKGIMDTLDASCIAFDEDRVVEIIDHRGAHGYKYMGSAKSGATSPRGGVSLDRAADNSLAGSVRHCGDETDSDRRTGKQVLELRLDLLPKRVTDLFFVLSTCNSRDLSKFAELRATFYDAESSRVLCSSEVRNCGTNEAAIMCNLYHLDDGLWRVNSFGNVGRGTTRDYKPILAKLLELGYPRGVNMRNQATPLLASIQRELRLDRPLKPTSVKLANVSTLQLSYVIELFNDSPDGESLVKLMGPQGRFRRTLLKALRTSGGERFMDAHLDILPVATRGLNNVAVDLCWGYPCPASGPAVAEAVRKGQLQAGVGPDSGNFLDSSCVVFEDQALREVVDYRGPHGVRIVCNGVLDYRGVWAGKVGVGDGTAGAVTHTGEAMDDAKNIGKHSMQVQLDKLPQSATDLIFVLSTPSKYDLSQYSDVSLLLRDAENPGHEIAMSRAEVNEKDEAVVMSAMCRDGNCWRLETYGTSTCQGNARDYRPMLLCLRSIQEKKHAMQLPQWPHRVLQPKAPNPGQKAMLSKVPVLPRLEDAVLKRKSIPLSTNMSAVSQHLGFSRLAELKLEDDDDDSAISQEEG